MIARIEELLDTPCVNVKATTHEHLGPLGNSAVSYTHLVGDAKVVATGCNKLDTPFDLLQIGGQVEGLTIDAHYAEAVSYTHLDVYKRQPLGSRCYVPS